MTTIYLLRHPQPFRKLLGEYNVNEIEQLRNEMMRESKSKPTNEELKKLREEYIKMMSSADGDFDVVSDKDSTYSNHMTLPTQSNGIHRR